MNQFKVSLRNDLEKLEKIVNQIEKSDVVSEIDIDLLLDITRKFYGHSLELRDSLSRNEKVQDPVEVAPNTSEEEKHFIIEEEIEMPSESVEQDSIKEEIKIDIVPEDIEIQIDSEGIVEESLNPESVDLSIEEVAEEKVVNEEEIPFVITQQPFSEEITMDAPEEDIDDETPEDQIQSETVVEAKSPRPELFDYLETSRLSDLSNIKSQPDLFGESTTKTIADKFQKSNNESVLDRISSVKDNTIGSNFGSTVSADIRQLIGINEKFLFINELFFGNMREYNDFILKLNDLPSAEDAKQYLSEMEEKRGWNKQSLAYVSFIKIFERKFK